MTTKKFVNFDNIPKCMQKYKQWVMWKYKNDLKLPMTTQGQMASVINPNDWATFKHVKEAYAMGGFDGICFVLTESDPYSIVDLDCKAHTPSRDRKILTLFYDNWLSKINTYNERSPSGRGYHAVFKKRLDRSKKKGHLEVYTSKRAMTFTGDITEWSTKEVKAPNQQCKYMFELIGADLKKTYSEFGELIEEKSYTPMEVISEIVPFDAEHFPNYNSYNGFKNDLIDILRLNTKITPKMNPSKEDYLRRIQPEFDYQIPVDLSDDEVLDIGFQALNGDKFRLLYHGSAGELAHYPSVSEADLALCVLIAFYTKNAEQIYRIFMNSALGHRMKTEERPDYVIATIKKALGTVTGHYDPNHKKDKKFLSNLSAYDELHEKEAVLEKITEIQKNKRKYTSKNKGLHCLEEQIDSYPEESIYTKVDGLFGEIEEHIYSCSNKTNRTIAHAGALNLMSRIVGSVYNTKCNMGLNQYIICIAETGVGKDAIYTGINMLLDDVASYAQLVGEEDLFFEILETIEGSERFASVPALAKELSDSPIGTANYVCTEIGLKLAESCGKGANIYQKSLVGFWLQLYTLSGKNGKLNTTKYSDKEKNLRKVMAPNFNIIGEATKESYYPYVTEKNLKFGLLPRFYHVHCDLPIAKKNRNADDYETPNSLVIKIYNLIKFVISVRKKFQSKFDKSQIIKVRYAEGAEDLIEEIDDEIIDSLTGEEVNHIERDLKTRSIMKIKKMAAVFAIGLDYKKPMIHAYHINIAKRCVEYDNEIMLDLFARGEVGENNDYIFQINTLRDFLIVKLTTKYNRLSKTDRGQITKAMHDNYIIPRAIITRHMSQNKAFKKDNGRQTRFTIENAIETLIENGEMVLHSNPANQIEYGTTGKFYLVSSKLFNNSEQHFMGMGTEED